jgi:hypothetical protein
VSAPAYYDRAVPGKVVYRALAPALAVLAPLAVAAGAGGPPVSGWHPAPARYSSVGAFAWGTTVPADDNTVLTWDGVVRDPATGLPKVEYGGRPYWNPCTVALWGLQEFNRLAIWHEAGSLVRARVAGDWLVANQRSDGSWRYAMRTIYPRMNRFGPDWVAAQAQGNAISLLVRLYAATRDRRYLRAAVRARTAFQRPIARHGVRLGYDGHVFFEGMPTHQPSLPLEDFQLSILALYDLSRYDAASKRLFGAAMRTLVWALPRYEGTDGRPLFDLAHRTAGAAPYYEPASATYNAGLLSLLAKLSGDRRAEQYAARWARLLA